MGKLARDVMTMDPACCSPDATLDLVARMMVQRNCGEIPVIDAANRPIGVVTDRDIVCRVVADGKNPTAHTAESCMTSPVVTIRSDDDLEDVIAAMESHQIRRILVVDRDGCCAGIIAQADVVGAVAAGKTAELLREVSDVPRRRATPLKQTSPRPSALWREEH